MFKLIPGHFLTTTDDYKYLLHEAMPAN